MWHPGNNHLHHFQNNISRAERLCCRCFGLHGTSNGYNDSFPIMSHKRHYVEVLCVRAVVFEVGVLFLAGERYKRQQAVLPMNVASAVAYVCGRRTRTLRTILALRRRLRQQSSSRIKSHPSFRRKNKSE